MLLLLLDQLFRVLNNWSKSINGLKCRSGQFQDCCPLFIDMVWILGSHETIKLWSIIHTTLVSRLKWSGREHAEGNSSTFIPTWFDSLSCFLCIHHSFPSFSIWFYLMSKLNNNWTISEKEIVKDIKNEWGLKENETQGTVCGRELKY